MNNRYKANPTSRLVATLIDLLICFVLYTLLASFVINPIVSNSDDYKNSFEVYERTLCAYPTLIVKNENDQMTFYLTNQTYDNTKTQEYDNNFIAIYNSCDPTGEQAKAYVESQKAQDKIFVYDEASNTCSLYKDENGKEVDASNFYLNAQNAVFQYLHKYLMKNNSEYNTSYTKVLNYTNGSKYAGIFVSLLIVFLLFPMIFKNGETLGKKIFSLRLGKISDDVEPIKKWQVLVRFVVIALEVMGSLILYGIPLLVSMLMMMFTKNNFAIHDYAARTLVLDNKLIAREMNTTNNVIDAEANTVSTEEKSEEKTENTEEVIEIKDSDVNE